jgi:hypothetical protein
MLSNETYSSVYISKHLPNNFPIQNSFKQGVALSQVLFQFALECTISKVHVNQEGLKLNETHQLLVYVDDVYLLGDNLETIKNHTGTVWYLSYLIKRSK